MRIKTSPTHQAGFFHLLSHWRCLSHVRASSRVIRGSNVARVGSRCQTRRLRKEREDRWLLRDVSCIHRAPFHHVSLFSKQMLSLSSECFLVVQRSVSIHLTFSLGKADGRVSNRRGFYCGYQISWLSIFPFSSLFFLHLILSVDVAWVR